MTVTRVPLEPKAQCYLGNSEELEGEPHIVSIHVPGMQRLEYGFYSVPELQRMLSTDYRLGLIPLCCVAKALEAAHLMLDAPYEPPYVEPDCAPPNWRGSLGTS